MANQKVFVSWTGDLGQQIASKLKTTILDTSDLDVWISSEGITSGALWFQEIEKAAKECTIAIGCLTPGAASSPWVNFEAGMLYGKLNNFNVILIGEQAHGPFAQIKYIDGTDINGLKKLFSLSNSNNDKWSRHIDRTFKEWKEFVDNILKDYEYQIELEKHSKNLQPIVSSLCHNKIIKENNCLRTIINISLQDSILNLEKVSNNFKAPQAHYPSHLIKLQKDYKAHVKAIALVQQKEQFWQQWYGIQIRDTASRFNSRIFVLRSPEHLIEHWEMLINHAKAYDVYILSYDTLVRRFEDKFVQDFSIIKIVESINTSKSESKVLAIYDKAEQNTLDLNQVQYIGDIDRVCQYENVLDKITEMSVQMIDSNLDLDGIISQVFNKSMMNKRNTEMSEYVSVEDYDKHEEEHAYYKEMMEEMLKQFNVFYDKPGRYEVLEFGSGTGIFTRRLVSLENIAKVAAVEIDWGCYLKLQHNLNKSKSDKFILFYEDSRSFNPPGKYDAIFSSFADHHIRSIDKKGYLENVINNLVKGGVFIVGDEFLPEYDKGNIESRDNALRAYHGHIIDIANKNGHTVLVQLETAALNSGLEEIGDFKVTCAEYETYLQNSGFTFERIRIGPDDDKLSREVGGVYVYIARLLH